MHRVREPDGEPDSRRHPRLRLVPALRVRLRFRMERAVPCRAGPEGDATGPGALEAAHHEEDCRGDGEPEPDPDAGEPEPGLFGEVEGGG